MANTKAETAAASSPDFDTIRKQNPDIGLAIYALEPGGPVTLEIITPDEQVFTFRGATQAEALAKAFPPETVIPVSEPEPPAPEPSIFD